MRTLGVVLAAVLAAGTVPLFVQGQGGPAVLVVDADDGDPATYDSLQAAIDAADPGAVIEVHAGLYEEAPVVDVEGLTIEATEAGVAVRSGGAFAVRVAASQVTLRGFAVNGDATDAVVADGADGLLLDGLAIAGPFRTGVVAHGGSGVTLRDVTVAGVSANCAFIEATNGIAVEGGSCTSAARGLHFVRATDVAVTGATLAAGSENDLVVEDVDGATLADLGIQGGFWGVLVLRSTGTDLRGIDVVGAQDQALRIEDSQGTFVDGFSSRPDGAGVRPNVGVHVSGSTATSMSNVTIDGAGQNGFTVRDSDGFQGTALQASNVLRGFYDWNSADVRLDGVTIGPTRENGLVVEDGRGTTELRNVALRGQQVWGLWVIRTAGVTIADATIDGSSDRGLRIEDSSRVVASGVRIGTSSSTGPKLGLEVVGSQDVTLSTLQVQGAEVNGGTIGQSTGVTLEHASFQGIRRGLHLIQVQDVTIANSTFAGLGENGIVVEPGAAVRVLDNQLDGGGVLGIGIWFRGLDGQGPGNEIGRNEVTGFRSSGISLDRGAQGVWIHDNQVTGNNKGIKLLAGGGSPGNEVLKDNLLENNVVTGNTWGIYSDNTHASNTVRGGRVTGNTVCDFVLRNDTALLAEGVDYGIQAFAERRASITAVPDPGDRLVECPLQGVAAGSLGDHDCDGTEWHFVLNQVSKNKTPPSAIYVRWANGQNEEVPLDGVSGSTAHYRTTANLDGTVNEAFARPYAGWSGQFRLSHGPTGC